jgi:hypothetical protein
MRSLIDVQHALAPGEPIRAAIGRAFSLAMVAAVLFEVFMIAVKDIRPIGEYAPWAEDPYDVFTSFGIFVVACVCGLAIGRLPLFRRSQPLPVVRAAGLMRAVAIIDLAVAAVLGSAWLSVFFVPWSIVSITSALIGALALESLVVVLALLALWRAGQTIGRRTAPSDRPDWLDDALSLMGRRVDVRSLERLSGWIRAHRGAATVGTAFYFGAFFAIGAWIEGDPVALVVLIWLIGTAAMFAMLTVVGTYLRLVASRTEVVGSEKRRSPVTIAAVAACAVVPVTLAFRDMLWWIVGTTAAQAAINDLAALLLLAWSIVFAVALIVVGIARRKVAAPRL